MPIKLESGLAKDNVPLEVYYDNGKIKLFTKTTNYSGGKLKQTFKKALKSIDFQTGDNVLILGFGMGSVWEIIRRDKKQMSRIHGVDYEPLIFQFIEKYYSDIPKDKNTELFTMDALGYMRSCEQTYTHIIIDLFIDNQVAKVILESNFVFELFKLCKTDTVIVINTMGISDDDLSVYNSYFKIIDCKQIEKTNKVYYLRPLDQ